MLITLLLCFAVICSVTSSLCSCDIRKMQTNVGLTPDHQMFAQITYNQSADLCDLAVHCTGYAPLTIGTWYSSTIQGDSPILDDPGTFAILAEDDFPTTPYDRSSLNFQYMRCVDGDWMVYMAAIDYLGINDPSEPDIWIMYNNVFCIGLDLPSMSTAESIETTTFAPTTQYPQQTTPTIEATSDSNCNCGFIDGWFDDWDPSEIWVDLVIILDTSSSMGDSLEEAKSALTSFINLMSTDSNSAFYSRIGVIAASDTIEIIYNLNMSSIDNLDAVKQHKVDQIDVGAAFQAALKMFSDGAEMSSFREDAKQIIYYLTNSAPGSLMNAVNDFKTGGGIIIVNDFVLEGEVAAPGLKKLASDNFYFTDLSKNYLNNLGVLCEANCFCKPSKHPFNDDEISPRTQANRGCFHPVNNGIPQQKARETCQKESASLVSIHDPDKEFFVNSVVSVFGPKNKYWLGLEYKESAWQWDDKSTDPFTDWNVGQPDTNGGKNVCAYATQTTGLNVRWTAANCAMGGVIYVCESAPCSCGNKNC